MSLSNNGQEVDYSDRIQNTDDGRIHLGKEKFFFSGFYSEYPVSEELENVWQSWTWIDSICGSCNQEVFINKGLQLAHLITHHDYARDGSKR